MNEDAASFWRGRGGKVEDHRVTRFRGPTNETDVLLGEQGAGMVPLLAVVGIRVSGPDAVPFLQGQLSNDLSSATPGRCQRTLQLNVRGQVVAEATLCRRANDLFLAVEDGRGALLYRSLADHIVFDDVRLEDLGQRLTSLTVQGPDALGAVERAIGEVPADGGFAQHEHGDVSVLVLRRDRCGRGGVDVHMLSESLPAVVERLVTAGATPVGEQALTVARVTAGLPAAASEASAGLLPQESGLEPFVSYRKGCYLGQEIMARIEARGNVRRGLVRLRLEGGKEAVEALADADDDVVRLADRPVGVLGSVAYHPRLGALALAVVRRDLDDDELLSVSGVVARIDARLAPDRLVAGGTAGAAAERPG